MIARTAGIASGGLAAALWFWLIGAVPVMQTLAGVLLGIAAGLLVWAAIDRRLRPPGRDMR